MLVIGMGRTKTGVMGSTLDLLFVILGDNVSHSLLLGFLTRLVLILWKARLVDSISILLIMTLGNWE